MNKFILLLLGLFLDCGAMTPENSESDKPSLSIVLPTTIEQSRGATDNPVNVYIPQHYDVTEDLHRESRCCFCAARWLLQPLAVASPLISSVFVGFGEYYVKDNPNAAQILNGIGLGFGVVGFISSTLLIKVNTKLENIDNYILSQQHR